MSKKQRAPKKKLTKADLKKLATTGTRKAKDAARVIYDHRKQILEALEMMAAVAGIIATVLSKTSRPRKKK